MTLVYFNVINTVDFTYWIMSVHTAMRYQCQVVWRGLCDI